MIPHPDAARRLRMLIAPADFAGCGLSASHAGVKPSRQIIVGPARESVSVTKESFQPLVPWIHVASFVLVISRSTRLMDAASLRLFPVPAPTTGRSRSFLPIPFSSIRL